ncbi:MAG TPA: M20 family metallo-hydrolase [Acidobacteriaceae bacterium]|jgi:N-carbamoyl-L-amino-acid hydrolase|nr:M20 family metallo-hydrolase [Acidobacteriaceae bacterium]
MPDVKPVIAIDELMDELVTLAGITEGEPPVVTRVVFSEADLRARAYVKRLCHAAGLTIREDAIGNTFARWAGSESELPPVATGSHIDAIPNAGAYDGTVGVLGGLEAIRALQRAGFQPRRSIELVIFTAEEPTRFGIGCLGSRLMGGVLTPGEAAGLRDNDGLSLDELRRRAGFFGDLEPVLLPQGYYHAFVELHIEQGKLLERDAIDVGIVTHIAAPASLRISIEGEGGHAGAMLMPDRRDALCAAAEITLAIEQAAKSTGAIDTVATVGVCEVFPGAINSVPSRVKLEVDVRDTDAARRDGVLEAIQDVAHQLSARRQLLIVTTPMNTDPPATSDSDIVKVIELAATAAGLTSQRMVSRAYHDSLFVARFAPVAMIFIPCRNGVSHRPDEYSSPEWIKNGVEVLARTLARLAG